MPMQSRGIDDLIAQLRAAAALAGGAGRPVVGSAGPAAGPADFGASLKAALDRVNASQQQALGLARDFEQGAKDVALHDVMLSMQKANIAFQGAVQVRNRLVAAYHDIMNMQI